MSSYIFMKCFLGHKSGNNFWLTCLACGLLFFCLHSNRVEKGLMMMRKKYTPTSAGSCQLQRLEWCNSLSGTDKGKGIFDMCSRESIFKTTFFASQTPFSEFFRDVKKTLNFEHHYCFMTNFNFTFLRYNFCLFLFDRSYFCLK